MPRPGDKLTDFITTSWYDEVTQSARKVKTGIPGLNEREQYDTIIVKNHSTTAKRKWDAVSLGTPALDYEASLGPPHKEIVFNTIDLDGDDPHNLAILQEPLPGYVGASATALVVGRSWLFIPEPKLSLDYIHISDTDVLEYSSSGRIEVIRDFQYIIESQNLSVGLTIGPMSPVAPGIMNGPATQTESGYLAYVLIGKLAGAGGNGIIDIRVNGYNFEYTFDGETWIIWHEGAPCTS